MLLKFSYRSFLKISDTLKARISETNIEEFRLGFFSSILANRNIIKNVDAYAFKIFLGLETFSIIEL